MTLSLALAVGAGFAIGAIAGWIISEDYSGYRNLGLNRFEATVASVASNTPVVGAGWALGEMGGGRSLRGSDYGKELTGWDYAFRGASVVLDVGAPFISKLLPGASNSLKVAPSATRGRLFRTNLSPSNERLFEGGLNAAQDAFDPMLSQLFKETGTGKFQGIWLNRFKPTQFHDVDLAIYFQREAHLTGRVIGEEVQHAIDFAMGATKQRVIREALTHTTAEQAVDWWHRRVFTRLLQNTHRDQFGLGVLRPYMNDIHQAYQNVGGRLSMDEILRRQFSGIF